MALGLEFILGSLAILLLQSVELCRGAIAPAPTARVARPWTTHAYLWRSRITGREHRISYATAGCGPAVVLCHGFGANVNYWRATIPELAGAGFKVYALDFLGFGASDKPTDVPYSIELWTELARDFIREFAPSRPCALVGNSIGSLIALNAAAERHTAGDNDASVNICALALLNCAGGMNSKFVLSDCDGAPPAWQRALLALVFGVIDFILTTPALRTRAFASYASEANVRGILESVYADKARVDEELVCDILAPASDPSAAEVFGAILSGQPGLSPFDVVGGVRQPILAVWGDTDAFTPLDGPTGRLFARLAAERENAELVVIPAGHVPHDDNPAGVLDALIPFLRTHLPSLAATPCAPVDGSAAQIDRRQCE
jgi:pimeloyl-ACP methyl ester carboxylesterase